MQSGNYDQISPKSLQIKHEERFFTRPLSKEANSVVNSSFRVYYGGATGAIPFRWESRPGTPKHSFSESSIPPLTPPPSYYSSSSHSNSNSKASSKSSTLLSSIFPRLITPRKSRTTTSSSFSSGSSSSSSSFASWSSSSQYSSPTPFVRPKLFKRRRRFSESPPSLPYDYSFDDNEGEEAAESSNNSPTSTLCFGGCNSSRGSVVFRGCYQLVSVKNALLSIVGHRSASRGTLKS